MEIIFWRFSQWLIRFPMSAFLVALVQMLALPVASLRAMASTLSTLMIA